MLKLVFWLLSFSYTERRIIMEAKWPNISILTGMKKTKTTHNGFALK